MEKIIVLGTSGAVTNARRDNVSLVFCAEQEGEAGQYILLEQGVIKPSSRSTVVLFPNP